MTEVRVGLCGFTMAFDEYIRRYPVVAGGFRRSPVVLRAWDRTLDCARLLRATAILLQLGHPIECL